MLRFKEIKAFLHPYDMIDSMIKTAISQIHNPTKLYHMMFDGRSLFFVLTNFERNNVQNTSSINRERDQNHSRVGNLACTRLA